MRKQKPLTLGIVFNKRMLVSYACVCLSPEIYLCVRCPSFACFPTVVIVFRGTGITFQIPEIAQDPPGHTHSLN